MHPMFADWYRLADLKPEAETLEKRWQAITAVQESASVAEWLDLVRLFVGRPQREVTYSAPFAQRFKDHDPVFPLLNNDLELQVLAGAALMQLLEDPSDAADAVALALVSVDCRGRGVHGPISSAVATARSYLADEAIRMREDEAPQPAQFTPVRLQGQPFKDIENLSIESIQGHWSYADARLRDVANWNNELLSAVKALHTAASKMADAINTALKEVAQPRESSAIRALREETNVLWWLFGERSRDLDAHLKEVGLPGACLIVAKELVDITTILPGPVSARAVLGKALMNAGKVPSTVKLQDAVNRSPREWRESWMASVDVAPVADLVPVHRAVYRSLETDDDRAWVPAYNKGAAVKANLSLAPLDFSHQVYEEGLLLRAWKYGT